MKTSIIRLIKTFYSTKKFLNSISRNQMDFTMNENIFCMSNPLNTFISKNNKLYMHFQALPESNKRSLVMETGYFAYKYLYSMKENDDVFINFADFIPTHIGQKLFNYTTSFEIRVEVPNTEMYFMPILSECNLQIKNGKINVKTSSGNF